MKGLLRQVLIFCVLFNVGVLHAADSTNSGSAPVRFVTQHFPPFSYIEQGQVAGPARALIDKVCQALAQSCQHQLLPWERSQKLVQLDEADAMYVIGWNAERSKWLRFSVPLLTTEYGFFVQGDDPLHQIDVESLVDYKVAALGASNTLNSLESLQRQGHQFEIIDVTDSETAFRLLSVGRVDAVYSNREVGRSIIRQLQLSGIDYAVMHRKLDYFVGFNAKTVSKEWLDRFNQQLQSLQQQGETKKLLERYGLQ
ncbi:MAG: transporter substrate-binding domain-containing protein [Halopseudomonas sp.]